MFAASPVLVSNILSYHVKNNIFGFSPFRQSRFSTSINLANPVALTGSIVFVRSAPNVRHPAETLLLSAPPASLVRSARFQRPFGDFDPGESTGPACPRPHTPCRSWSAAPWRRRPTALASRSGLAPTAADRAASCASSLIASRYAFSKRLFNSSPLQTNAITPPLIQPGPPPFSVSMPALTML